MEANMVNDTNTRMNSSMLVKVNGFIICVDHQSQGCGRGQLVIGASEYVVNYNVPLFCKDIGVVQRIARRVSGRGGGLASVKSMALVHDDAIKVACNLVELSQVASYQVQGAVKQIGAEAGVMVGKGYFTNLSPGDIIKPTLR